MFSHKLRLGCLVLLLAASTAFGQPGDRKTTSAAQPRRVFVPLDELDVVLDRDSKGVMLSRKEFEDLYRKAQAARKSRPRLPRGIVLSNIEYEARIAGDQLLVTAKIEFTQFADGWQILALPLKQLAVERATLDGKPARLGRLPENGRTLQLLNDKTGRRTLLLELSTPLSAVGSDKVASLGLVPATAATLNVTLPAGKHLLVDGLLVQRPAAVGQQAVYKVAVGGKQDIVLRITDRRTDRRADVFVLASTRYAVSVAPGAVSWQADTTLQVFGRSIDRLVCAVPKTLEITDVDSGGLEAWELADSDTDPTKTTITLRYRQPFDGSRRLTFKGVMTMTADEPWTIPNLGIEGVASHVGRVAVVYPRGTRLRLNRAAGVRRVTLNKPSPKIRQVSATTGDVKGAAGTLAFDVWQEDFTLDFITQTKQRELIANIFTTLGLSDNGLDLHVLLELETLNAPLFELDVVLPANWAVTTVAAEGKPLPWRVTRKQQDSQSVRVRLDSPLSPGGAANRRFKLLFSARLDPEGWPVDEAGAEFDLPEVRLPQAGIVDGSYLIHAIDDFEVVPVDVRGLDPAHLSGEQAGQLGYRYQDTRFSGRLRVAQKPSRLSVQTLTYTRLDPLALRSHLAAEIDVEGGGLRSLDVALPAAAAADVQFRLLGQTARIVEQRPAEPADGKRVWTLKFDRRLHGRFTLAVDVETRRGDEQSFQPHVLEVPSAERQNGIIAVEAEDQQRLKLKAVGVDGLRLADVDPVDLPRPKSYRPRERIVAVFRYTVPGFFVTLQEERFDRVPVPTAVCLHSHLKSVFGATGDFQHQARFQIVAVGVQSLGVRLSESAELWSTLIDSQPVEVRRDGDLLLVPLPPGDNPEAVRTLELFYRTRHDPLTMRGRIRQQTPTLSAVVGGTQQPLEILQQDWEVSYPPETMLTRSTGRFQPAGELDRSSLLSHIQQGFAIGSLHDMTNNLLAIGIAVVIIAVLTLGYRRRGLIGLGAGCGVLMILFVVSLLSFVQQERENASYFAIPSGSMAGTPEVWRDYAGTGGATMAEATEQAVPALLDAIEPNAAAGRALVDTRPGEDAMGDMEEADAPSDSPQKSPPARTESRPRTAGDFAGEEGSNEARIMPSFNRPEVLKGGRGKDHRKKDDGERPPAVAEFFDPPNPKAVINYPAGGTIAGLSGPAGALLSVAVEFEIPANHVSRTFRYIGSSETGEAAALDLSYENSRDGSVFRLFLAVAVLCVFWFVRQRSIRTRAVLGALGITLPLGLIAVTPVSWHIILDGLFFGSLAGVVLWLAANRVHVWSGRCRRFLAPRPARTIAGMLLLAALILPAGSLLAQQKASGGGKPSGDGAVSYQLPPSASSLANRSAASVASHGAQPVGLGDDETIVVPYNFGEDPLKSERVFLPQWKFLQLWNDAYPEQRTKTPAPTEGLVAGALYSARLAKERNGSTGRIAVTARFVLHSFRDHQITLPLPLRAVAVRSASLDGKPAPLLTREGKGGPGLQIVVASSGLHLLDVEFDLPARLTGPAGQFTAPLLPVATGKFTFLAPDENLTVRAGGASGTFRRRIDGQRQLIEVPIDGGGDLKLTWQPAQQRGNVDAIVHSETVTAVGFDDAGMRMTSGFLLRVRQGALNEIGFSIPPSLKLQTISGPDVGGWGIEQAGDERVLRVFLRRRVDDETRIQFELFQPATIEDKAATFPLPQFAPREVTRDIGTVGVYAETQFVLRGNAGSGIGQINPSQFSASAEWKLPKAPPQLAYRYTTRPFELNLSIFRRRPETRAVADHAVFVGRRKISVQSWVDLNLRETPRSRLAVRLSEGYLPLEVTATGLADWYLNENEAAGTDLIIELESPRTGAVSLSLTGTIRKEPDAKSLPFSLPYPLDVNRLESRTAVRVNESYLPTMGVLENWKSVRPDRLSARLRQRQETPVRFAFLSPALQPGVLTLNLQQAKAVLEADGVTTITVGDAFVDYRLELQWKIKRAATDRFAFTAPDWLAGKLVFRALGLRQVIETDLDGPRTRWEVILQDPVRERYYLQASATLPPPTADRLETPVPVFVERTGNDGSFGSLETQAAYVVLVNLSRNQISAKTRDQLEPIEPEDLPIKLDPTLIDQASELVRLHRVEPPPEWTITKFEHEKGAAAVVNVAELLTVVERDGSYRTQATYRVRNRTRQFLPLLLPAGSKLLSVFVKDRPSLAVQTIRNKRTVHLVPLPNTSRADPSFFVRLVYSGRLKAGSLPRGVSMSRAIDLPASRVLSVKDDEEFGVPVGRTLWRVYLPPEYQVAPVDNLTRNNFTLSTANRLDLVQQIADLKDYLKVSEVLTGSSSDRTRYYAAGNLKQLGLALHNYHDSAGKNDNGEARQYRKLREQVSEQERFNYGNVRIDDANQKVVIVDDSSSMWEVDEKAQKQQIRVQQNNQFLSNSAGIVVTREDGPQMPKGTADKSDDGKQSSGKYGEGKSAAGKKSGGNWWRYSGRQGQSFGEQQKELNRQQSLQLRRPKGKIGQAGQAATRTPAPGQPKPATKRPMSEQTPVFELYGRIDVPGDGEAASPGEAGQWTQAGGLSLDIQIPKQGQVLSFSKVSGDPRLAIAVRPSETLEAGLGIVWTIIWLAVGSGLAIVLSRDGSAAAIRRGLPTAMIAFGLVAFFLIPSVSWLGFMAFLLGAVCLGFQHRRAAV